jgi:EmrB/QacA subfamily drug resistance transporter
MTVSGSEREAPATQISEDARWVALAVLCVGMLMMVLDGTIVNVALPSIQSDLGFTPANLAWVINGYTIAFGGFLLLAGRLGDLVGSRRVFIAGLCLFTFASLLCGIAWTRDLLVGARFIQGIGGALASSVVLSMVVTMFTEADERAKAMGYFNFTASAGGSIGLLLGGLIAQIANWHWVFFVNIPIGVAAVVFALRYVTSPRGQGLREGADVFGAFLITSALMIAVYTVVEMPVQGFKSTHTLIAGTIAALLFITFIARQATAAKPLLPLGVFRSRNLNGSNLIQVLVVAAMFGFFFLDSLHFRRVLGYNAMMTGLAFMPVTLAIGTLSLGWSAQLAMHFGPRRMIVAGAGIAAAGLAWAALARQRQLRTGLSLDAAVGHRRWGRVPVVDDARDVDGHESRLRDHIRARSNDSAGRRRIRARNSCNGRRRHERSYRVRDRRRRPGSRCRVCRNDSAVQTPRLERLRFRRSACFTSRTGGDGLGCFGNDSRGRLASRGSPRS